jgi:hypothetical protein
MDQRAHDRVTTVALGTAFAVPVLYFGAQAIAMPTYPNYDLLRQVASELGSDRAPQAALFNCAVLLVGGATLIAAFGYLRGLRRLGAAPLLTWLVVAALTSNGLASLWAGSFHLPDPRHNPGVLGAGVFLLPPLLLAAVWRLPRARLLRLFLLGTLLGVLLLAPFMAGALGAAEYPGLLQRLFALLAFLPISAGALYLLTSHQPAGFRAPEDGNLSPTGVIDEGSGTDGAFVGVDRQAPHDL